MNRANVAIRTADGAPADVSILNPRVAEIAQALLALGGAAHRDLVVAFIAKQRGVYRPSDALRRELSEAFAAYCGDAGDPRAPGLLHLPHGPFSHRWALTEQAYGLLRGGVPARMAFEAR